MLTGQTPPSGQTSPFKFTAKHLEASVAKKKNVLKLNQSQTSYITAVCILTFY